MTWVAVLAAALAAVLLVPVRARPLSGAPPPEPAAAAATGGLLRWRPLLALLAGAGAGIFLGGTAGLVVGPPAAAAAWVVLGRSEPTAVRRRRERVARDLPHVVTLLAAALRSGASPAQALRLVCRALPGPATERLHRTATHLDLGADPTVVWAEVAGEPGLAPLGRALARSQATGASVVAAMDRLSEELARDARGAVEDRARAVGVKAALPLGLCLLPSFLLLGIVPLVAGLLATVTR
ncbi:type II secretion system F family protein [Nocardioides sp. cx-173]|uniref:type II secretion system F family protein n=1 Tax=Nocardioides sp. cx-173 TaxID=2898796 RepID=UPI001E408210|nr:type II secretion system F family protein [Nocardioides sp. cx-173]MCD4523396.1 type II secretion system F family protein [Nocardioides sp. cx-173]UGB42265.1 type II secretion system F family protein [Nocardioides sp. cx-173]